ncbi:MAG: hypothetical protein J7539_08085 [Niabella sp.]|nr:hypothetical protein [Niabella sp.]
MKRLLLALILSSGLCAAVQAQTAAPAAPATAAKTSKKSTGLTKSGKPDMRLKANKEAAKAKAQAPVAPAPAPVAPAPAPKVKAAVAKKAAPAPVVAPRPAQKVQAATTSADQSIGTDAKGRTLYRGPRGGTYYINSNGHKEYVKHQ